MPVKCFIGASKFRLGTPATGCAERDGRMLLPLGQVLSDVVRTTFDPTFPAKPAAQGFEVGVV